MAIQSSTVELLGKDWFVDSSSREFLSKVKFGEHVVVLRNQEMNDMLSIKEIIDDRTKFELSDEILSMLKELFSKAVEGDRTAIEEISKICNQKNKD